MIYLDAAATSFQKPAAVGYAVSEALRGLSSPGRGGYASAMAAADTLLDCRTELADLFSVSEPERVIFTSSATHGLNIALKTLVGPGDRVVVSGYEHNAVMRPLRAIGAEIAVASSPLFSPEETVEAFRRALPGAKAAVCCHVSNVFGYIQPLDEISELCRKMGVPLAADLSQSAGTVTLDFDALGLAFAAMPGHKGLMGPQGTGVLLCGDIPPRPLMEGGTGSDSESGTMPSYLPDRLEAGTHNMPGIAGLLAGVRWVRRKPSEEILVREIEMRRLFSEALKEYPGVRVFEETGVGTQSGVISMQIEGLDCEDGARLLGERGIAVRAGLHCAPLAHRTAGTLDKGTIRFSFSPFTNEREVLAAARAVSELPGAR